ncbi:MAG: HEAT repeat domain-containing protein [Elusimicrobia bacterium]|nr:HEAT repeat domain-containing protein [Elusimicrobiota bacterium]
MKVFMVLLLAGALGWIVWSKGIFKPAPPPPPPPPPPPAILSQPAPVISAAEMQKVLKSAQDPDANVRWQAVVFLDKVKAPEAMPLMQQMLERDQDPGLRIKIINLLSNRSGPDVMKALVTAMGDLEPTVRTAALQALDKIGDFSVAPAIANGPLHDQDDGVRLQAMKTLNDLQDKKQKEIEAARQKYEAEKQAAAAAARQKQ